MRLSKRAFSRIIMASARSASPLDDEILREIAEEHGDDPELLIERHKEFRELWIEEMADKSGPTPIVF